jgi:PST family polysaccharide transporter
VELVHRATQSVKWSVLGSIAPRFITPITTVLLALILRPADYGVVAASATVISLAQIVVGLGMGSAVVQRRTQVAEAASAAFWMSLSFAGGLYGLLWVSAPWISQVYHNSLVSDVVRVSGVSLLLFSLGSIPKAFMQRKLEFWKLFWVDLVAPLMSNVVSVALAFAGMGLWALVLGPLVGTGVGMVLTWRMSGWRPTVAIDWQVTRSLIGFSSWVVLASLVTWFFGQADNAVCGYYLGPATLGAYALGFNLSGLFPALIVSPLAAVAYPAFCAVQIESKEMGYVLLRLQSLTAAVVFPVALGLSAVSVPGVALLYGNRWPGLGLVIQLLAIMPGLSHVWSLNAEAYRAVGRPDVWPKLGGITLLVLMPLLVLAAPHGLFAFTIARLVGASLLPLSIIVVTPRILDISMIEQLRAVAIPFGCAAGMFAAAQLLIGMLEPLEGMMGWLKLLLVIVVSAVLYLFLLMRTSRELWNGLLSALRRMLSGV